jgi:predicted metalloprotease with PDZ domain
VKTYTFEELMRSLNEIAPYNWSSYFHERLNSTSPEAPLGGIENGGWKVVYTDQPLKLWGRRNQSGAAYSLGLQLGENGDVTDSIVGGPAYISGITSGMKVVGVNGRVFTRELLDDAIRATKDNAEPITLLVIVDDYYKTCAINYRGGERFPHLARQDGTPDFLDELIKPRSGN